MWNWGYKILVHEVIHTFGIPDLDLAARRHARRRPRLGPDGQHRAGAARQLFAWNKFKPGWVTDQGDRDRATAPGTDLKTR